MYGIFRWCKQCIPLLLLIPVSLFCQQLTLEQAQELARKNYPAIRQKDLLKRTAGINVSNLNKNYLPQLSINGQASYQSSVTSIDVDLPGVKFDSPAKDQYKVSADIDQLIYDGGATKQQKTLGRLNTIVEDQQVEVELYKLKEKVNDIFLTILYTDELIRQNDLVKKDLQTGLNKLQAQVQYGVAFRSSANILKAELLKTGQRLIELESNRNALIGTLALFTGQKLNEQSVFEKPVAATDISNDITRPEMKLFNVQTDFLGQQNKLIASRNLPRTSLFFHGGYGRPALNLLKNDFEPFYITGVRFSWALNRLYTTKNDRQLVKVNQEIVDIKKETFLLNINAQLITQQNDIVKLSKLIAADNDIIELRRSVTNAAKAQLDNGVMTANDYLVEVNAEDQSRQVLIAHQIQLLQAQIIYNTIKGK
ncbi:MAG TPA: TolC family protein [Flavitalea sp.]|nr:TolC family protein [Flavitalea sp.]